MFPNNDLTLSYFILQIVLTYFLITAMFNEDE